jgi:uncharacterized HAD superfamily protein/hypoxanthine phosphoribosyltransferase
MNYRGISDLNNIILKQLSILPRDIDLIVGIPRSGMLPANLLALYLNKPYTDIDSFMNGHIYKAGARGQFIRSTEYTKILVVDDSVASGSALNECRERLRHLEDRFVIEYCGIYVAPGKERSVDYYFEVVSLPRYFQWNIFNHTSLEKACFDIDGVLCVDPRPEENDDGDRYKQFLLTAAPLFLPGARIGTLVTSRLEKYRYETETWLRENGVSYDRLIMLDLPDMAARQQTNSHAIHKAKAYASGPHTLFVESDPGQAAEINRQTKKPVFCTDRFEMVYHSESFTYNLKSGKHLPLLRKYALKMRDWYRKLNINRGKFAPSPKIN